MEFLQNFPDVYVLTSSAIHKIAKKFKTAGLVLNKERKRRCPIFTEENLVILMLG
jgi:hypothetical protein